jgi:glycosyltransferase involved in cell wall biosynthesis
LFTKKKIAAVSVINDLVTDSRVQKTCAVLAEAGYDVVLIGRRLPGSLPLPDWTFKAVRMNLLFRKGPAFYFFFNFRLFFRLLFTKADLLFANDLDTLWPNYTVSKLKDVPLIYDSHELFCDVPELLDRPIKRKIWQALERRIIPKLKNCITVNNSLASILSQYGVKFEVIRNISEPPKVFLPKTRRELGLPEDKKIVLLQGAGINIQRGAEELMDAMIHLENALLLIIGSGDVWPVLQEKSKNASLKNKVRLIEKIQKSELLHYTFNADLGVSIDKNTNPNYYNSLPNKIFDYLQAGVPILASDLPEIRNIICQYDAGWFIDSHEPAHIAEKIKTAHQNRT